ncbi:MAG: DUF2723 domain-containing protein [Bacteroidetes bacterium]|nr:DUF2723 domain-containing protein [Bacteroidota bacterium]
MTGKQIDRLVAAGVFLYALVVYFLTMAETASFWDAGEFIASVYGLQVMHPPGAPFYILVGRFFTFFAPLFGGLSPEPIAFSVNFVSVLASALTVLLTHFVIVRLVRVWKGSPETWGGMDRLAANAGGVIGALAFATTDSFWFNAVEAEVYALSMLFTALVVWLILRWREETLAEEADLRARGQHPFGLKADRHLLLIAYIFGLAIGVHLLNLLALFFIALVIFFTKVDREEWTPMRRWVGIAGSGIVGALAFFAIYPGIIQWLPEGAEAFGSPTLFFLLVVAALVAAVVVTQRRHMPIANLVALSITMVMLGYSTYGLILLRSAADPPIDLNDPETAEAFVSYLKREQYGSTPLLKGYTYNNQSGAVGYEVDPRTGGLVEADEASFPRRWSPEPAHADVYAEYHSDWDYFRRYQIGHMYVRYFMWQFAGRAGDYQDADWISGLFGEAQTASFQSPSERASRNAYFGLPLLLGLIGMAFHFVRDWRRAFAVLILFFVTGIGIIIYLNQYPNQPRERDYSYVASFFAFSLWVGLGATGLMELAIEALKNTSASLRNSSAIALAVLLFVLVPGRLLTENYYDHDRSGRRLASDFARNMLESTAPNAIIFTNGDNDTYPLWYMQHMEGLRTDVRVVNLSLLNTPWYIDQLKNQWALESAPIPMTLTDEEIREIRPVEFEPADLTLPVSPEQFVDETISELADTTGIGRTMTWRVEGRPLGQDTHLLYVADRAALDIIVANARGGWQRPIYFASTVAQESELNLQPFFQDEGLARRVMPFRTNAGPDGRVIPEISLRRFAKYEFRNLDDPDVYYDENSRNMADTYRRVFASAAAEIARQGHHEEARALLERISEEVPHEVIPESFLSLILTAEAYRSITDMDSALATLRRAEDFAIREAVRASANSSRGSTESAAQFVRFLTSTYVDMDALDAMSAFYDRLAEATDDPTFRISPEQLRRDLEPQPSENPGSEPTGG